MSLKAKENLLGAWAFLIGVVLAVIIGLFSSYVDISISSKASALIVILGIGVGLFNVGDKDANTFLIASLALVIVSYMGAGALVEIPQVGQILGSLLALFVPATIIVALKSVFSISKA